MKPRYKYLMVMLVFCFSISFYKPVESNPLSMVSAFIGLFQGCCFKQTKDIEWTEELVDTATCLTVEACAVMCMYSIYPPLATPCATWIAGDYVGGKAVKIYNRCRIMGSSTEPIKKQP